MKAIKTTFNDVSRWQSEGSVSQVTGAIMAGLLWLGTATGLHAQSVFPSSQPSNQVACLGGCLTYSVAATGTPPLSYQWRIYTNASGYRVVPGETNDTIVLCNVPTNNNRLRVVVTDSGGLSSTSRLAYMTIVPPPSITQQPKTPSLGVTVVLSVAANSSAPSLSYQWQFQGTNLPGQTQATLTLQNVSMAQVGNYTVVVSNIICGISVSAATPLDMNTTFTQVTAAGALLTDTVGSWNASWVDYDGDGYLDFSVAPGGSPATTPLYHNEGDGTFRKVTTNAIGTTFVQAYSHVWGDYDNDGKLDLFVPNIGGMNDMLFHNNGGSSFTRLTTGHPVIDGANSAGGAWADYDRDGFLDLFVSTSGSGQNDLLYRNNGEGTFRNMTIQEVGAIVGDSALGDYVMWADVDNDGSPELSRTVASSGGAWTNQLLHLDSQGKFYVMDIGEMKKGTGGFTAITSFADYDNDGFLDALVSSGNGLLGLYRNLAGQGFTNVAASAFPSPQTNGYASFFGDYDNDGWLDLVVQFFNASPAIAPAFFRNNGDGTFTYRNLGGPSSTLSWPVWGDYNNDGFLDVLMGPPVSGGRNSLFRHNGNTNHWLKVTLDGRASNRSGIGARVRVHATIGGTNFWQMREISGQGVLAYDNGLLAHFGLGDATNVTTLRIEWPSGIVQELPDVAANQSLTVVESQSYGGQRPALTGVNKTVSGLHLGITEPDATARYLLEASSDLTSWTKLMARTSAGGTTNYLDSRMTNYPSRFYRLQVP